MELFKDRELLNFVISLTISYEKPLGREICRNTDLCRLLSRLDLYNGIALRIISIVCVHITVAALL